ncbi:MAG: hypothetical protein M1826_006809 [Phylliscum demangeonii]|nr:MAG: hypothetical protein M1826_006809 [Phylliscum demangeonii]
MSLFSDPVDPLLSMSDDKFRALLGDDVSLSPDTAFGEDEIDADAAADLDPELEVSPPPAEGEKKATKKRKSWGQELPTPKTNLPPRKRAKTDDEKEQRRIERVLRNRAAAQSSRERKRKEIEGLEEERESIRRHNTLLTTQLQRAELENQELSQTIAKMAAEMTVFRQLLQGHLPAPAGRDLTLASPTLSVDLLPHRPSAALGAEEAVDRDYSRSPPAPTVDPRQPSFASASDSPPPEACKAEAEADADAAATDSTQHPAVMLCDLPCQSVAAASDHDLYHLFVPDPTFGGPFRLAQNRLSSLGGDDGVAGHGPFSFDSLVDFDVDQPFVERVNSHSVDLHLYVDREPDFVAFAASASASPALARPLRDATGRALRLMSRGVAGIEGDGKVGGREDDGTGDRDHAGHRRRRRRLDGVLSWEFLITMMWAIESIEREPGGRLAVRSPSPSPWDDPATDLRPLCARSDNRFAARTCSWEGLGRGRGKGKGTGLDCK